MAQTNTVDLYARISDDQAGDAVGVSNQLDALTAWCSQRGWTVGDVYRDDSISAVSGKERPAFEALLSRTDKRPVAVWHTDRLIRVTRDLERVIDQALTVHALHAGHLDLSTPAGRAVARTVTAWATYEGEQKAARQRLANAALAAAGRPYWRRRPFGHSLDGRTLVEAESALIGAACADVLAGVPLSRIAQKWQESGVAPIQAGKAWTAVTVRGILLSARIAGLLEYKGEVMPQSVIAPIVDEATWRAVVGTLTDSKRGKGGGRLSHLLTGIARCGTCGDTVVAAVTTSGAKRVQAYKCKRVNHNRRAAADVETYIVDETIKVLVSDDAPELLEDRDAPDLDALRVEAGRLRGVLSEWEAAAASMGPAEYLRVTAPLRTALTEVEQKMQHKDRASIFAGLVEPGKGWATLYGYAQAADAWEALPFERKRAVLSAVWSVIELRPGTGKRNGFDPASVVLER